MTHEPKKEIPSYQDKKLPSFYFTWLVVLATLILITIGSYFSLESTNETRLGSSASSDDAQQALFSRGLQGNSTEVSTGKKADPSYIIRFPKDHGSHDDFDIEWWYLTANLEDELGEEYDLQWTLFRFKSPNSTENNWGNEHTFMAHASVHSKNKHWFSEKFARGGIGIAGATSANTDLTNGNEAPFSLFIEDWLWQNTENELGLLPANLTFNTELIHSSEAENKEANKDKTGARLALNLQLENKGEYVLQGTNGYSIKSGNAKHASHYYSAPFIEVAGEITPTVLGQPAITKKVTGKAWFDQEWTSQLLDAETLGWDWLSLHLDDGNKIMAFRMRLAQQEDYITGTFISSKGKARSLLPSELSLVPTSITAVGSKRFPLDWQLKIPSEQIDLRIKVKKDDQYNPALFSYYEGAVRVSGSHSGEGFLELTGY